MDEDKLVNVHYAYNTELTDYKLANSYFSVI